jgi:hypothetical protein
MKKESIRMDCPQFEEALADLDRPGTQGAVLREIALAHAESCCDCASLLTESESLDFSLHSLAAHTATRAAPARVETALLQQFRKKKGLAARRRLQWQLSVLGAAAVLVLAFGISLHRGIIRFPGATPDGGTFVQPSASSQTAAGNITPYGLANDTEDPTAFTPLPFADDPSALEGGAVVRVELSASALASLGFRVTDVSDTGRIWADLVVSDDGTPQAIRMVLQENLED